jgi:carbon storage regulator
MLVLSRRIGEEIVIAGNIRVTVVGIKGRITRLGFTAPASVHVVRRELLAECPEGARSAADGRNGKSQVRGAASTESAS